MSSLRVTSLRGRTSGVSPTLPDGAVVTGVTTSTTFSGNLVGTAVTATITGNVTGNVTGNATGLTGTPNLVVGVITATSFSGDGINLTNVGAAQSTRTLQTWLFGGG